MDTDTAITDTVRTEVRADLHTHILPCMDDGSASPEESAAMLDCFLAQNVTKVAATPHFYISENAVEGFLKRRAAAFDLLRKNYSFRGEIILGAEVCYAMGLYRIEDFRKLAMGNSRYILIELPSERKFDVDIVEELEEMMDETDLTIIFAHIERFWDKFTRKAAKKLLETDAVFQINLSSLADKKLKKTVLKFLKKDVFTVVGSDSHNMGKRHPRLYTEGAEMLSEILGREKTEKLLTNTLDIFREIAESSQKGHLK